jgi:hypothetical protein
MSRFLAATGVVAALAATAVTPARAHRKPNPAARALFKKAIAASDIEAKSAPAFRFQAEVLIPLGVGQTSGMAIDFWAPGHLQRTEMMLTGYDSLTVINGKRSWTKKSIQYTPYPIQAVWQVLDFVGGLRSVVEGVTHPSKPKLPAKLKLCVRVLKNLPGETKHGKKRFAKCVDSGSGEQAAQYCFDYTTGHLVEEWDEYLGLRYFFSNYQSFGNKTFPRTIRVDYVSGHEMLEVDAIRIDRMTKPDPKLFAALPGVKEEEGGKGCRRALKKAKLIKQVMPVYPKKAKDEYIGGVVVLHATVGANGAVHALWPLESPSSLLTVSALTAVRQWRYQPTVLCRQPVHVHTIITVVYRLGSP